MRVVFVERTNGPERLVCDAEVVFEAEAGPLAGMKLVGFALWRSAYGEVFGPLPSRRYGVGGEPRYFDRHRSATGAAVAQLAVVVIPPGDDRAVQAESQPVAAGSADGGGRLVHQRSLPGQRRGHLAPQRTVVGGGTPT